MTGLAALRRRARTSTTRVLVRLVRRHRRADKRLAALFGRALGALPARLTVSGERVARRAAHFCAAAGNPHLAEGLVAGLAATSRDGPRLLAHQLYVDMGDVDSAAALAATMGTDRPALLAADRLLAIGDPVGALAELDSLGGPHDRELARRRVAALGRLGRPAAVLADLADDFSLPATSRAVARFDALWLLGRPDDAFAAVEPLVRGRFGSIELLRRFRDGAHELGLGTGVVLERLGSDPTDTAHADELATALFETDHVDELIEFAAEPSRRRLLGPTGEYQLAQARYVRREFEEALAILGGLLGTGRHWDAEKLEARILLEEGRFEEALDHRRSRRRLRPTFDEVEYFARLHLGQLQAGFESYVFETDTRRLTARFGERADLLDVPRSGTGFVVPQNGPGDELQHAATYGFLLERFDELAAACDPRLATLLGRSFPSVRFVPSERLASRHRPGFLAPERPARDDSAFFDLLTAEAGRVAERGDAVVLGRSLIGLSLAGAPYGAYLSPDPDRVGAIAPRLGHDTIGLVWRSEFQDAMRSIHYLVPRELSALAGLDVRFVCLQHDASPAERDELFRALAGRVTFLDDLDLRDDFEAAAAVVASCRSVVGVGTTMLELAAAVGTPAIALHPNRFGSWRARSDGVGDYWHRSMRVAVASDPRQRDTCVAEARALLVAAGVPVRSDGG